MRLSPRRADSAFYGRATIGAAVRAGADVSVTVRPDPKVKKTIATIDEATWTTIEHPNTEWIAEQVAVTADRVPPMPA